MNEQEFYKNIQSKSAELGINPLLLLSGIEGLYTFKDVPLNSINYTLLDNLILSILALRIGDQFHNIAEKNLNSNNNALMQAAADELKPLTQTEIMDSGNDYLISFAEILNGKNIIRRYHVKALDAAALEIKNIQIAYGNESLGVIILQILKSDRSHGLSGLFNLG